MLNGSQLTLNYVSAADLNEYIEHWADMSARGLYFPNTVFNDVYWRQRHGQDGLWSENGGHMVMRDKQGNMVGAIFFFKPQLFFDYLEIGYIVFDRQARGKGYASEALKLFSDYLFSNKPLNKIILNINPDNAGSLGAAKKNGFIEEGIDREAAFAGGKYVDIMRLSKLRSEWEAEKEQQAESFATALI